MVHICALIAVVVLPALKLVDQGGVELSLAEYRGGETQAVLAGGRKSAPTRVSIVYVLEGTVSYGKQRLRAGDAAWEAGPTPRRIEATPKKVTRLLTLTVPERDQFAPPSSFARRAKDAVEHRILGGAGTVRIVIDEENGGDGSASVGRIRLRKGAQVPEHVHVDAAEIIYVVSGRGTLTLDGVPVALEPGSASYVPPNTKHAFVAAEDFAAVQFYAPGGPEQRFKAPSRKE